MTFLISWQEWKQVLIHLQGMDEKQADKLCRKMYFEQYGETPEQTSAKAPTLFFKDDK
jgi:hypothetical protein